MNKYSSSFTGTVNSQAFLTARGMERSLSVAEIAGKENCTDPGWKDARISYWPLTDMTAEGGSQRGYWIHDHGDGATDFGTFEGKVTMIDGQMSIEGNFRTTGGTGRLAGISGEGTYHGVFTSPMQITIFWQGAYRLAAEAAAR